MESSDGRPFEYSVCSHELSLALDEIRLGELRGDRQSIQAAAAQAIFLCRRLLSLDPCQWPLHEIKAQCEYRTGQFRASLQSWHRAARDEKLLPRTRLGKIKAGLELARWEDSPRFDFRTAAAWVKEDLLSVSTLLTLPLPKDGVVLREAAAVEAARRRAPPATLPPASPPLPGHPLRLGYVSPDCHNHAVAHQLVGVLERHDRRGFHSTLYSVGPLDESAIGRRLRQAPDAFRQLAGQSAAQLATQLRLDGIDVAIDLAGHTFGNRIDLFSLRPAPLQISWLGYPGTTGADYIDYLVVDGVVAPPEHRRHFSEALLHLPGSYLPADDRQPVHPRRFTRRDFGLPEPAVVLAAFHPAYKINAALWDAWMEILRRAPSTHLWLRCLHPELREEFQHRLQHDGIAEYRYTFDETLLEKSEYLAKLAVADLFLDAFHFNGHSTVSDALWAGLPVITCPGEQFAARVGASILQAAGCSEWIARDAADYVRKTVSWCGRPDDLQAWRQAWASAKSTSAFFSTDSFTRHWEQALRAAWDRLQAGLPPADLPLPSSRPA